MMRPGGARAVLHRELLTNLRTVRAFAMVVLFVGLCAIAVTTAWPGANVPITSAGAYARASLGAITTVLFALCSLFMPFIGAMAVAAEREQDTFEMMRVTLIPPRSIVLAKMVAAAGFFAVLLVAAAPVISAIYFLAGVETETLLQIFALLVAWMLAVTALGVCVSAYSRRVVRALIGALMATAALVLLGPLLLTYVLVIPGALFGNLSSLAGLAGAGGIAGSPFATLTALFMGNLTNEVLALAIGYNLGLAALFAYFAIAAIGRPETFSVPRPPRLIEDEAVLRARRMSFPFYLIDPLRRQPDIDETKNPMTVKELRWGLMQRGGLLIRVFYIALAIYLLVGAGVLTDFASASAQSEVAAVWHTIQLVIILAAGPAFVANTVTKEFEMGNADALNMTLLEPKEVIGGKLRAGVVSLAPLPLAAIVANTIIYGFVGGAYVPWFVSTVAVTAAAAMSLGIGMLASTSAKRTTVSLLAAYIGTIAAVFAIPALLGLTGAVGPGSIFRIDAVNPFALSPLGLVFTLAGSDGALVSLGDRITAALSLLFTLAVAAICLAFALRLYASRRMREA